MILLGFRAEKYHQCIIEVCKRLRVYTIVDFSFVRTFAPSF